MKYLLDTHAFIWLDNDPARLSTKVTTVCADRSNLLLLSLASVWEMQIKLQLGRLTLPTPLADTVQNQIDTNQVELLPIKLSHIFELDHLPHHHKDPFDRLLMAQALSEKAILITDDAQIARYSVPTFW